MHIIIGLVAAPFMLAFLAALMVLPAIAIAHYAAQSAANKQPNHRNAKYQHREYGRASLEIECEANQPRLTMDDFNRPQATNGIDW